MQLNRLWLIVLMCVLILNFGSATYAENPDLQDVEDISIVVEKNAARPWYVHRSVNMYHLLEKRKLGEEDSELGLAIKLSALNQIELSYDDARILYRASLARARLHARLESIDKYSPFGFKQSLEDLLQDYQTVILQIYRDQDFMARLRLQVRAAPLSSCALGLFTTSLN